jgi:hypothetical protein
MGAGADPEQREEGQGDEAAQGEDVAVGEVDQLDDAVDHRVAEGDQGVDRPVGDAHDHGGDQGRRILNREDHDPCQRGHRHGREEGRSQVAGKCGTESLDRFQGFPLPYKDKRGRVGPLLVYRMTRRRS